MESLSNQMREASIQKHNELKSHAEPCMHPSGCTKKGRWAHATQRKGPLKLLAENGHLVELEKEVAKSPEADPTIEAKKVGWKRATAFRAVCEDHDGPMFKPIDDGIDLQSPEHKFLLAYRACMASLYKQRVGVKWHEFGERKAAELGLSASSETNPFEIHRVHFTNQASKFEAVKSPLDSAYMANNFGRLQHEVFGVESSSPSVAASGMFSDRDASEGEPAFMMVNLIPKTNGHDLLLSFLPEHSSLHKPYVDLFNRKFAKQRRELTSRLLILRIKLFALRPSLWKQFSEEQQAVIKEALDTEPYAGDLAGLMDPKLNVFEPVL